MNRKKHCIKAAIGILTIGTMLLSGCAFGEALTAGRDTKKTEREYNVIVQDSDFFNASIPAATVKEGDTFSTELVFEPGFYFESSNYEDCIAEKTEMGVKLTVSNIKHDYRIIVQSGNVGVSVSYPETTHTITYYANGGRWKDGKEFCVESYRLAYHFRANTNIGSGLSRKGYTLIGWNTNSDGSGIHVGLGSRTEADKLYAEWVEWADPSDFVYKLNNGCAVLTGYKGKGDMTYFAIPEEIDGYPIEEIDTSFTTNMPCGSLKSEILVLPASIKTVKNAAFTNAAFKEVYFYDTLEAITNGAFSSNPATYHINAGRAPVYQYENDNVRFADKVDYLMLQEGKRLVFFAGCSASYGLCSELIANEFPEYSVCNMGVIGGLNAVFQMQIIGDFLREGDIFVHLPEEMSAYQLMSSITTDYRMFIMVEGNYDLMAHADFSHSATFWESYVAYIDQKKEYSAGSYQDGMITYNHYGDICFGRPYDEDKAWEKDVTYSDYTYQFDTKILTEEGIERLCGFYREYNEKGVTVYIGYAPVNIDGLKDLDSAWEYESKFCELVGRWGYTPIGSLKDHIFKGRYFYDSDYHLNNFGAILQTEAIIKDLKSIIK